MLSGGLLPLPGVLVLSRIWGLGYAQFQVGVPPWNIHCSRDQTGRWLLQVGGGVMDVQQE